MATLYGVNKAKGLASPSQLVESSDNGGVLHVMYDSYTSTGVIAATDVIVFGSIPKGARIMNCVMTWTDLGTTGAGVLGFSDNTDALGVSADLTSAGQYISDSAVVTNAALFDVLTEEKSVQFAMSAATTAAGTIKVAVTYAFV